MTKDKRKLKTVTEMVKDMYQKINENGGYYVVDLTYEVEELASELELDVTFDSDEILILKKSGYKLSKDNTLATRTFRKIPVFVMKVEFNEFVLRFGEGRHKELEDSLDDITDAKTTSAFFINLFDSYKDMLKPY